MDSAEAASALKQVAATERRSAEAYSYSLSAPYFFVWGVVWLLGYGAEALAPKIHLTWTWLGWWWTALTIIGAVISVAIGQTRNRRNERPAWRIGALFGVIWFFIFFTFTVLHPRSSRDVGAFIPLLFSAIYAAVGLWMGLRYILVGVFVAAATLGGYFWLGDLFFIWMALVGGGSLLLTGLWLKRA